jgi:hypothetical protein
LRFYYTAESWQAVARHANVGDLILSIEFNNPTFDDLKRLIESGFILELSDVDSKHLCSNINIIGAEQAEILNIEFNKYPINSANSIFNKVQHIEAINNLTNFKIHYYTDVVSEDNNLLALGALLTNLISNISHNQLIGTNPLKMVMQLQHNHPKVLPLALETLQRMIFGLCANISKQDEATISQSFEQDYKYIILAQKLAHSDSTLNTDIITRSYNLSQAINNTKPYIVNENLNRQEIKIIQNKAALDLEDIEYLSMQAIVERVQFLDSLILNQQIAINQQLFAELKTLALKISKLGVSE